MPAITQTPVPQLTITWPQLPEDFPLPDAPVENTDQPLLAAALRQPLTTFPDLTLNGKKSRAVDKWL